MNAKIRANRIDITDRYPMLGFTIRTDGSPQRVEVAIAVEPLLFRQDHKARRTMANFYSSRAGGPLMVPRGEAVYVVPPEVLARFVGQDRLYVALATTPEQNGAAPRIEVLPSEGSPYISLKGLTNRSLKRVRMLPSRQRRAAGYVGDGQAALEWWGDTLQPGMEQVPMGTTDAPTAPTVAPGNGGPGNGGKEGAQAQIPVEYDDGFGELPSRTETAPALSRAQGARRVLAQAQEIITPFYDPSDPSTALTCQNDAFSLAREEWFVGVPDTRIFPHSATCQLQMTAPDGSSYKGTGFYIGSNRILTCAHNLHGMSSVTIISGRNGAANKPFGQTTVTSASWRIAPSYGGSGDWSNDLAVIENVPLAAPNGQWFRFLNATPSDRLPIVVCGYSAGSRAVPELTEAIDGDAQHLHGGYATSQSNLEVIEYPILTLMGASGSPVYSLSERDGQLDALVCAVHVTGEPAAAGLNRGCFITPAKINWIEGRTTAFALGRTLAAPRPQALNALDALKNEIAQIAGASDIARYSWRDRGVAPAGYIKGMALVYARVRSKFKAGDAAALEMAKAKTADADQDALAWYDDIFAAAGMNNDTDGIDTLRHLFVLLIGLGMRESSGRYCEGRDRSAGNTTAETAEAGLFQTSFNARHASPLLPVLFAQYLANPSGFLDVFQEGVRCSALDLENFGSGDGREFQRLSKECPAFAAEFAAVGLRNVRKHWGPITRRGVEVRPEADALLRQVEVCVDAAATSAALSVRAQGMFDLLPVDLKLRVFIPAPVILMERPVISDRAFGGDGRGFQFESGTSRAEITAQFHFGNGGKPSLTDIRRAWGESTEYNPGDTVAVPGKPSWYRDKQPGATPIARDTLGVTDDNLTVQLGGSSTDGIISMAENSIVVSFHVAGSLPLVTVTPDIDANLAVHLKVDGDRIKARVRGGHDEFPAYELYANDVLIYSYDPLAEGGTPFGLVGTGDWDVEPETNYVDVGPATEFRVIGPIRIGAKTQSHAQAGESLTINWDEVELIPQPTEGSCWAAAAAMVVGWKDRMSLSPETVAQICNRTSANGLDPAQVEQFANEIGLVFEHPQSYTVDGFRQLLESKGPLWIGAAVPGLHAIVVTGIYQDGTNTFVRITDPWDREVGAPGAPGSYLPTHSTGSRYIMGWGDFVREYEKAATDYSRVNLQILHSGNADGRLPNYGSPSPPPGYAQSLTTRTGIGRAGSSRPRRLPPPPKARSFSVPIASARRQVTGNNGGVTWELDQYDGMKSIAGAAVNGTHLPTAGTTINLSDWPYIDCQMGRTYAAVVVNWKYQGGMVGDVQVAVPKSIAQDGYALKVTADISDGPDTTTVAALRIAVRHEFSSPGEPTQVAVTDMTLYGDGRYERQNRWEPAAQPIAV